MSFDGEMAGGRDGKRRTGWLLTTLALSFFLAIMVKTWLVGR